MKCILSTLFQILIILAAMSLPAQAQPTRDRILGDLEITEEAEQVRVQIDFNFPIRYIRHFPESEGDELRIQLEPINLGRSDQDALFQREAITADKNNPANVDEVVYEGDNFSGLQLTVYFKQPQSYSVQQGNDYRSILVTTRIPTPESTTEK